MSAPSHIALRVKLNQDSDSSAEERSNDIITQLGEIFEGGRNVSSASNADPVNIHSGSTNYSTPPHLQNVPHPTPQPAAKASPKITHPEEERSAEEQRCTEHGENHQIVTIKEEEPESPVNKEQDEVERHIEKVSIAAPHHAPTSPLFPGISRAVPHTPEQCTSSDCIHKFGPQTGDSYCKQQDADSYNLNESRAEDSAESECETESVHKPEPRLVFEDPRGCVPRLNFDTLPGNHSDSEGSSARSDSLEYLKNIFGPSSPYPFINPYYLYMNHFHPNQFISPRPLDATQGIVRPTAQYTPPFSLPPFSSIPIHSPLQITPPNTTKPRTKRKSASSAAKAPKRPRPVDTEPKPSRQQRLVSCNTTDQNGVACDEKFHSSQQLVCHIENIHKKEAEHVCKTCAKFSLEKLMLWRRRIENEKMKNNLGPSLNMAEGKFDIIMIDK